MGIGSLSKNLNSDEEDDDDEDEDDESDDSDDSENENEMQDVGKVASSGSLDKDEDADLLGGDA